MHDLHATLKKFLLILNFIILQPAKNHWLLSIIQVVLVFDFFQRFKDLEILRLISTGPIKKHKIENIGKKSNLKPLIRLTKEFTFTVEMLTSCTFSRR